MRPLFTVHAGEYVVGNHIERNFRRVNLWIPAKDTGVDLLVSNQRNKRAISLQIKYSRDFLATSSNPKDRQMSGVLGWWTLTRQKIALSPADYWIFVLVGFANRNFDFVIVRPAELLRRLDAIHGPTNTANKIQTYFWITKNRTCWEARGLRSADKSSIEAAQFDNRARNFTAYLNNWRPIETLNY